MQAERCHVNSRATEVQLRSNYLVHCLRGLCMHTQPTVDSIHFGKCGCLRRSTTRWQNSLLHIPRQDSLAWLSEQQEPATAASAWRGNDMGHGYSFLEFLSDYSYMITAPSLEIFSKNG